MYEINFFEKKVIVSSLEEVGGVVGRRNDLSITRSGDGKELQGWLTVERREPFHHNIVRKVLSVSRSDHGDWSLSDGEVDSLLCLITGKRLRFRCWVY